LICNGEVFNLIEILNIFYRKNKELRNHQIDTLLNKDPQNLKDKCYIR